MKIAFACQACGYGFNVDAAHVGRRARCKGCGGIVVVPEASSADDDQWADPLRAHAREGSSASVADSRGEREDARPRKRRKSKKEKLIRQAKEEAADFLEIVRMFWKWLVGVPLVAILTFGPIVAFVPNGAIIVASILAAVGSIMLLTGFVVGAYGAFHEDFLNGMLYVFIPIYTAYWITSNWDGMWRWFLLMGGGAILIIIASQLALPRLQEMSRMRGSRALNRSERFAPRAVLRGIRGLLRNLS